MNDTKTYSIEELKKILYSIFKKTPVQRAILFGSYAKNVPTQKSDVDILIDSEGNLTGLRFFALVDMIQEKLNKDVDVIEKLEIEEDSPIHKEIEETGVVIYERKR